jgi:hypothetical protein
MAEQLSRGCLAAIVVMILTAVAVEVLVFLLLRQGV